MSVSIFRFKKNIFLCLLLPVLLFFSCSSSPKRQMLVTEVTNFAYSQLEEANRRITEESYVRAFNLLTDAYKLALSVDNTELLCKVSLSGIILKISCPEFQDELFEVEVSDSDTAKSFLVNSKEEILVDAKKFASRSSPKDRKLLSSICSVYEVRILLENAREKSDSETIPDAASFIPQLDAVKSIVSKEPYYNAFFWRTRGDVCMACGRYAEAQKNFLQAAKIHTKERYLIEIALDWYCVARSCSMAGKKSEAISAILTALKYDRDAENTNGIASDYKAYSKILLKGNPSDEETKLAAELSVWGDKVLRARK